MPTYESIGIWAPIALLLLRVLQGIGLGSEWGGGADGLRVRAEGEARLLLALPQVGPAIRLCIGLRRGRAARRC